MTYVRRPHFKRRPKDHLHLALKSLFQGEEIIVTTRTYDNIKCRVDSFNRERQDRRMAVIPSGSIRKIRRVV